MRRSAALTSQQADDLWRMLPRLERLAEGLSAPPSLPPAERVDRVHSSGVGLSLVKAAPAVGGFVTRRVVERVASRGFNAFGTAVAAATVLALCDVAGVRDPRERFRVVAHAVTGRQLPDAWEPPAALPPEPEEPVERESARARARTSWKNLGRIADLRPNEARMWQRALGQLPVVGLVGGALAAEESLEHVVRRACAELGLPAPSGNGLRRLPQVLAARARTRLGGNR